ncbi:MAG: uroporphyrinogen-III decarboxylase [Firmicutes bacterium]|nr:uroporphyrinogen-III decarboxylase [Bacillota bacterium]
MKCNMDTWKNDLIASGRVAALPIMTYPGLELSGKKLMDIVRKGEDQAVCIESLAKRYNSVAAVTVMDLSVEAEAFGSNVKYSETEVPTVIGHMVTDMKDAEALRVPAVGVGRTTAYLKATELAVARITDRPVFGGIIGPFSLAGRLMDMTAIMVAMMRQSDTVTIVLEKCAAFLVEYAKAIKGAGANGIVIAEPAAGLLSPKQCDKFSSCYVKQIVDAVQDENFMIVLHNCGKTVKLVDSMVSTGAAAYHIGNAVSMTDIMPQMPSGKLVMGNINPSGTFRIGTVEQMVEEVNGLLDEMSDYNNFVLSSGCDIPPGTPLDNIDAFFATLEKYNNK